MMLPLCPTSGKVGYPSRIAAKASLLHRGRRQIGAPKYVYRCPECRQWHLTRVPPERFKGRRSA